jgi:PTS system nitrogen regulatory IIA component
MAESDSPKAPKLAELFPPQAVVVGLKSRTKNDAVAELAHVLAECGRINETEERTVVESILAREKIGSSALYNGFAFPHCRVSFTERFVGALGIEPRGIPFDALDGEPVRSIFLFLAPLDRREELYDLLGRIMAIGSDKSRRLQLQGCRTAEAVHRLLTELDNP